MLALPLTFGLILQLGFYSYCYATLLFLAVAGYHARHRDWSGGRVIATMALLLALTYMAHAFVFAIAGLLLVVVESWTWLVDGPRTAGGLARRLALVLAAAVPGLLLLGAGIVAHPGGTGASGGLPGPAFQLRAFLESALLILPIAVFDQREAVPALLVSGLLIAMGVVAAAARRGSRILRAVDGYLAFAAALLLGILLVPDAATIGAGGPGAFVTSRLAVFVPIAALLWLAAHPFGTRVQWATLAVSVVASVGLLAIRLPLVPAPRRPGVGIRVARPVRRPGRDDGAGQPRAFRAAVAPDGPDRERDRAAQCRDGRPGPRRCGAGRSRPSRPLSRRCRPVPPPSQARRPAGDGGPGHRSGRLHRGDGRHP